jgi:pimeloyl-ACP methyl ester carboxylesterase
MTAQTVDEEHFFEDGGSAFLVRPSGDSVLGGVLWLHWFDPNAVDGNRTQFLTEAQDLAAQGVVSVLPQLLFPWSSDPSNSEADIARIQLEVDRLRHAVDWLAEFDAPVVFVGHDFGAMHGLLLMARDRRIRAAVLMAPANRWADWFLPFWRVKGDPFDYMRALAPLDPIERVAAVAPRSLFFQYAENDFYIAAMDASQLHQTAGQPKRVKTYPQDHALRHLEARADRRQFILAELKASDWHKREDSR